MMCMSKRGGEMLNVLLRHGLFWLRARIPRRLLGLSCKRRHTPVMTPLANLASNVAWVAGSPITVQSINPTHIAVLRRSAAEHAKRPLVRGVRLHHLLRLSDETRPVAGPPPRA